MYKTNNTQYIITPLEEDMWIGYLLCEETYIMGSVLGNIWGCYSFLGKYLDPFRTTSKSYPKGTQPEKSYANTISESSIPFLNLRDHPAIELCFWDHFSEQYMVPVTFVSTDMPNQPNPLFNIVFVPGPARWLWLVPWEFSWSIENCWLCWPAWIISTWSRCSLANRTLARSFCKAKSSLRGPRVSAGIWFYSPDLNQTSCGHRL